MNIIKKGILEGINGDDSLKMVSAKAAINVMNAGMSISQTGRNLRLESRKGTIAVNQSVHPAGTNLCIGSAIDLARNRIVYALYNSNGNHGFFCYETLLNITRVVLLQSQANLNFDKAFRIDRNMKIIGDLVYYTDNNHDLRRFNIEAAIKMNNPAYVTNVNPYEAPLNDNVISVIRNPPQLCPTWVKKTNNSFAGNNIDNEAFYFCARYVYRDGEISVLSPKSTVANFNVEGATENYIKVTLGNTLIDQDVTQVDLVVKRGRYGKLFVIKSWSGKVASEALEMAQHNYGKWLTYDFYNDKQGLPIDNASSVKLFDSVPLRSKTIEFANNRLMLGNNLVGYDTPQKTSLTATAVNYFTKRSIAEPNNIYKVTLRFTKTGFFDTYVVFFYLIIDNQQWLIGSPSIQEITPPNPPDPTPPEIPFSSLTNYYDKVIMAQTATYLTTGYALASTTQITLANTNYQIGGAGSYIGYGSPTTYSFKDGEVYDVSIVFYDYFMRQSGVYPNPISVSIPERLFTYGTPFSQVINYTLSNADAVNEIPDWAYFYSIVRTKPKKRQSFIQGSIGAIKYVSLNSSGEYVYNMAYSFNTVYTAIDISQLYNSKIGYLPNEGDVVNFFLLGTGINPGKIKSSEVKAVDGNFLLVKAIDFTTQNPQTFEIYTPANVDDPYFYEVGKIFPIKNPTTINRQYTSTNWYLNGDVYDRNVGVGFFVKAMSPNNDYWQIWNQDLGRVQIIDYIGQKRKPLDVAWSNVYLQGTQNNGLSSFDGLDTKQLPNENGAIQKLQLASKIGEQGGVLLAICTKSTVSMYLGQAQLLAASQNGFVATSEGVVGTINVLKQSYGTINPESVIEYFGLVFWYDVNNGVWVQYSVNGLDVVSKYKMQRYFANYGVDYLKTNKNDIEAINGFSHLPSAIDPYYKELLAINPALISEADAPELPSYNGAVPSYATSIINRFDVYDKLAKSISFKFDTNVWSNTWEFAGEWYDYVSNDMYGFKGGVLYKHNADANNWNKFYGISKPVRVCVSLNESFSTDRELLNTAVEGSHAPTFTVGYSENPNIQITDLTIQDYIKQGTVFFASFYKDRLSPNQTGLPEQKLFKGDYVTGYPILIMYEFNVNNEMVHIDCFDIGFVASRGLKQIIAQ